jgi:cytochrome c-type biogenesis protein CcmH
MAKSTLSNVNEAESLAGGKALPVAATSEAPAGMDVAENISVEGSVDIDQLVRRQVTENDTVFIFVRAASGPKFPLAVLRKQVKDLPMNFHLDDSMSMMPGTKLSDFANLVVGARISKSGSATPEAGDWEGIVESAHPGDRDLKIKINSLRK